MNNTSSQDKKIGKQTVNSYETSSSNRLLDSHLSVYQTLENSRLNNIDNAGSLVIDHDDPASFSITSWQSISGSPSAPKNSSGGTSRSVNSILSLSSDNEADNDNNESRVRDNGYSQVINNPIIRTGGLETYGDNDYDSDESGTFEIDINAFIRNKNVGTLTNHYEIPRTRSSNALSPSFIMPKMMVKSNQALQSTNIRICVVGNGLDCFRIELNNCTRKSDDLSFPIQYVFTNLNSKVDLVLLVFDSANGLYSKDLFNILKNYRKNVLPIINQAPVDKIGNKIVGGGISDGENEDSKFDINESILIALLRNNGIKMFAPPVKVDFRHSQSFEYLHTMIGNQFMSRFESPIDDDDDDDDDEEIDNCLDSASTWASSIIQNHSSAERSTRQLSSRHNSRSSAFAVSNPKKRRVSESLSLSSSKTRKKKMDKRKLSHSTINNSDPLKLNEKKSYTKLTIGIGLGLATLFSLVLYYRKPQRRLMLSSITKPHVLKQEKISFFKHPLKYLKLLWKPEVIYNDNSLSKKFSFVLQTDDSLMKLFSSVLKLIHQTKSAIFDILLRFD